MAHATPDGWLCRTRIFKEEYEISFGRQRKLKVPSECYIVSFAGDKFVLDKVKFEGGKCDYLKVLKDRNISYEIPKSLPNSTGHMYSRFECAVGAAWWAPCIQGYFGLNGYAITHIGYIGDDRYESYEICFSLNPGSFRIGEHEIIRISGYEVPKDTFIEKLLEEEIRVEEGESVISFFEDAGVGRDIENIRFETNFD